jgi:hypothetical protein
MHIYLDFVVHLIVEVYNEHCVKDAHDGHSKVVYFPIDPCISKILIVYLIMDLNTCQLHTNHNYLKINVVFQCKVLTKEKHVHTYL